MKRMHFTNAKLNPRFGIVDWKMALGEAAKRQVGLRPPQGSTARATAHRFTRENAMIGIVRLALRRPYTFIVMAVLILIFGTASALRTPTDIFPNINIPVISVVFSFTGLPADDMAGRVVTFYERSLPNSVNDIEHIESQSIANYGIIKIFFQPTVNINAALAQVNGMSQTVLKQMPPSITPPLILSFNASSVPILQLALSSDQLSETQIFDSALNFIRPALAPVPGAA